MIKRVSEDPLHGLSGFVDIASLDRSSNGNVVLQIPGEGIDGHVAYSSQNGLDRPAKAPQNRVVSRLQNRQMKILVGRDCQVRVGLPALHCLKRAHDALQIVGCGPLCGEGCSRRFDDRPRLLEGQKQIPIKPLVPRKPSHEFTIEHAPMVARLHVGSEPWSNADQPLRRQDLDCLSHDAAARAETRLKFVFGW